MQSITFRGRLKTNGFTLGHMGKLRIFYFFKQVHVINKKVIEFCFKRYENINDLEFDFCYIYFFKTTLPEKVNRFDRLVC
jgi:hypothetical protein